MHTSNNPVKIRSVYSTRTRALVYIKADYYYYYLRETVVFRLGNAAYNTDNDAWLFRFNTGSLIPTGTGTGCALSQECNIHPLLNMINMRGGGHILFLLPCLLACIFIRHMCTVEWVYWLVLVRARHLAPGGRSSPCSLIETCATHRDRWVPAPPGRSTLHPLSDLREVTAGQQDGCGRDQGAAAEPLLKTGFGDKPPKYMCRMYKFS